MIALVGLSILVWGLSTVFSTHPFMSLIRGTWVPLIVACVILYTVSAPRQYREHWARLMGDNRIRPRLLFSALVVLLLCGSLWQIFLGEHANWYGSLRARGFMPHPNDLAVVPVLLPFASLWAWPLGWAAVLLSGSRNALLGCFLVLGWTLPSWRLRIVLMALAAAVLLLMPHQAHFTNIGARLGHWIVAWRMFLEHPILGTGPNTFVDYYLRYLPERLPFGSERELAFIPWAHNLYLEQLAERGLLGFTAFALPILWVWHRGSRAVRAALGAFLVMGVLDLTFLKPWVFGAYWGLITVAGHDATH